MATYIGPQPVPQSTQTRQTFTATASQTSFATGGYQAGYIDVFLNGVKLVDGTDFTATNGSDVVLTTGAASGDTLEAVAYTAFEAANVTGATDFTVTGSFTSRGIDDNATSTAITIDSSQNVGINKVPEAWNSAFDALEIGQSVAMWSQNNSDKLWLTTNTFLDSSGNFKYISSAPVSTYNQFDGEHRWSYAASGTAGNTATLSEAMRIDSSGNLLVGTTGIIDISTTSVTGHDLRSSGASVQVRDGGIVQYLNRLTSDGDIISFRKNGTAVGSIGNSGSRPYISNASGDGGFVFVGTGPAPSNGSGSYDDNGQDMGNASARWDDVYATNGTIQTSDRNEKQDIEVLSDAETRVAQACKGLLRKFRWQDAVAEKGDEARIHFGIIAQDLQDAFTAEGLDAGRYTMFISSTWWETQTEVPAVEAVAEVLDEEGNVVTEAVEAKDAYTRTDTYEILEEAPEGATERTRLGVRYPELLAFIIAAI